MSIRFTNFYWAGDSSTRRWVECTEGKITAAGPMPPRHTFAGPSMDLAGKILAPGLIDTHIHAHMLGEKKLRLDLSESRDKTSLLAKLKKWQKENPQAQFLRAFGWHSDHWTNPALPTLEELDAAVAPNTSILLTKADGHAALINTATINIAAKKWPEIPRTQSYIAESAYTSLREALPPPPAAYYAEALRIAQEELFSLGIVGVHESAASLELVESFSLAAKEKRLSLYVATALHGAAAEAEISRLPRQSWQINSRFFIYGCKFFLDGSFGSRTAANDSAYLDTKNIPALEIAPEILRAKISSAIENGLIPLIHAIGSRAVCEALRIYAELAKKNPRLPLRLEHAELFSENAAELAKKIPQLVLAVQSLHAESDLPLLKKILPASEWQNLAPWKKQSELALLCGGSDAPMDRSSPFLGIARLCAHPLHPEQSLSREEAWAMYTKNAFAALGMAPLWGELQKDQLANFIVLDRDPLLCSLAELEQTKVLATVLGGEKVMGTFPPS